MQLVTPGIGLVFWMLLSFLLVLFLLAKFAWKPILNMLKEREDSIDNALKKAEEARAEMQRLKAHNEQLVADALIKADEIVNEAREIKENMIYDAKIQAAAEAEKLIKYARQEIQKEKIQAINEIRNQIAELSVLVAEKVIRKEISAENKQQEYIESLMKDLKLN